MPSLKTLDRRELLMAGGLGLVAPVFGALASGRPQELDLLLFSVSVVLISVPLLAVAFVAISMRTWRRRVRAVRWAFRAGALAELVLQLAGATLCFDTLHADALGAIAFLTAPIYAHALSFAIALVGALAASVVGGLRAARG